MIFCHKRFLVLNVFFLKSQKNKRRLRLTSGNSCTNGKPRDYVDHVGGFECLMKELHIFFMVYRDFYAGERCNALSDIFCDNSKKTLLALVAIMS